MPSPRVFISSTCYDLKYIRENLKYVIRNIGYEPVLSEEGAVFYDPNLHVQDACLAEVPSCQMFVLIIGGRYGGRYLDTEKSITNAEYNEAVKSKIPIFALVERMVFDQNSVFIANRENPDVDENIVSYPAVDDTKIFDFIDEVRSKAINNALVPFSDFEDIQNYLRQQWSSMMYRFLTSESEAKRVTDLFGSLSRATEKIEFLTAQIVDSVAEPQTKLNVEFYDRMLKYGVVRDLALWDLSPTPKKILEHKSFDDFCGNKIKIEEKDIVSIVGGGPPYELSRPSYERNIEQYKELREELKTRLREEGKSLEQFLSEV